MELFPKRKLSDAELVNLADILRHITADQLAPWAVTTGSIADTAVTNVKVAAGVIQTANPLASNTLRNSNDTQKATNATSWTKIKETKFNSLLAGCRIKVDCQTVNAVSSYFKLCRDGAFVANLSANTGSFLTNSNDATNVAANSLFQIYAYTTNDPANTVLVENFRFYYSDYITHIGELDLASDIELASNPTISMTNQDP